MTTTRPLYLKYRPSNIIASPPEVTISDATRRGASSNYLSLKSRATPRDRGEGSDGSSIMGMMEDGAKDVLDVTSSGIPVADLREAEGEVNKEADGRIGPRVESRLQDKVRTSSGSECNRGHSVFYGNMGMYFGWYRLYGFVWSINGYRYISTLKRRLFKIKKHKKKKRKKAWSRMSLIPWKPIKIDEKFKYQMPSKVRRIVKERRRRNKGNRTLRIPRQR